MESLFYLIQGTQALVLRTDSLSCAGKVLLVRCTISDEANLLLSSIRSRSI